MTEAFFKFIEDFRKQLADNVAVAIAEGYAMPPEQITDVAVKCQSLLDIEDMGFDFINEFYNPETEEEEDEDGTSDTE